MLKYVEQVQHLDSNENNNSILQNTSCLFSVIFYVVHVTCYNNGQKH